MNKHLFLYPELLSRLLFTQTLEGKYLVRATLSQQPRPANPEEIIRQIFMLSLIQHYRYPEERIKLEQVVMMGRERKRADILVAGDDGNVELIVEVKQDIDADTIGQLRSYLMATGAHLGAAVSGHEIRCFVRAGNQLGEIHDLPIYGEPLGDPIINDCQPATVKTSAQESAPVNLIENFERVNLNNTKLTIKGHTLEFANKDITDFKKVRQRYINDGIVLGITIQRSDWLIMIESFFANAAVPKCAAAIEESIENGGQTAHEDAKDVADVQPILVESESAKARSITDPIESFERINRVKTRLTIQGLALDFSNEELVDLKKVQRRYITHGIVVGMGLLKSDWMDIVATHFASAPAPASDSISLSSELGTACLTHLLSQILSVSRNNKMKNLTIREILQIANDRNSDCDDAVSFLNSSGINVKGDTVFIANKHPVLAALFLKTPWTSGWASVLKTIEKAESVKPLRFGGNVISRATSIPMAICLMVESGDRISQE